jgi:hypothetical protein
MKDEYVYELDPDAWLERFYEAQALRDEERGFNKGYLDPEVQLFDGDVMLPVSQEDTP